MANSTMQLSAQNSQSVDTKKIQDMMNRCKVNILVGFPSGRTHVGAVHNEGENGRRTGGALTQKDDDGKIIEVAELAKMLHFGAHDIPARPFLVEGINKYKKQITEEMQKEAKKAFNGQSANWNKIGSMVVGFIQEFVRSDYYKTRVPNSRETIEAKGSDIPLIDSADLINSMNYIVERK